MSFLSGEFLMDLMAQGSSKSKGMLPAPPKEPVTSTAGPSYIMPSEVPEDQDVPRTIFVSGIASGVQDAWVQKILSTCGPIEIWNRPYDTQNRLASFGFCVYETPDCVLRALRVIDGETEAYMEGVELEGEDGTLKRLRLNVDASARKYAQKYLIQKKEEDAALSAIAARKMGRLSKRQTIEYYNQSDEAQDERAYQEIQKILSSMKAEKADDFLSSLAPDGATKESTDEPPPPSAAVIQALPMMAEDDPLSDLPPEITREQKEIIRREIILFRQNTAEKDREKREREQRNVAEQRRRAEREFERERERKLRVAERRRLIAPNGVDITPGSKMLTKEDEEEERKRKEKRDEELQKAFKEREQKWELYEADRPKRLAAEEEQERDYEAHLQAEKEKAQAWLHSYNDDEEKDYDDFFRDRYAFPTVNFQRERWVSRRQRELAKEQDWDQQDALDEARESEEAAQAAQVVPEVSSVVGRIMTKEERVQAIQELVQKIPIDKEGLWEWPIKWDYLTESLLEGKLRPFVSKKVVEYIGAEETDLVDYAIRAVASRAGAQAVLNELQGALAEDAEIFVLKLWRMVIYETESRAQGIV